MTKPCVWGHAIAWYGVTRNLKISNHHFRHLQHFHPAKSQIKANLLLIDQVPIQTSSILSTSIYASMPQHSSTIYHVIQVLYFDQEMRKDQTFGIFPGSVGSNNNEWLSAGFLINLTHYKITPATKHHQTRAPAVLFFSRSNNLTKGLR